MTKCGTSGSKERKKVKKLEELASAFQTERLEEVDDENYDSKISSLAQDRASDKIRDFHLGLSNHGQKNTLHVSKPSIISSTLHPVKTPSIHLRS